MAYEVNDARNRSETYKEGGKVENKKDFTKGITDESIEETYSRINRKKALQGLERQSLRKRKNNLAAPPKKTGNSLRDKQSAV